MRAVAQVGKSCDNRTMIPLVDRRNLRLSTVSLERGVGVVADVSSSRRGRPTFVFKDASQLRRRSRNST
jgi:hypothetical protein